MLIDRFLPDYHFASHYAITIDAPVETTFARVRALDLRESRIIRVLIRLRGMPSDTLTREGLNRFFVSLGEVPDRELVMGLAGRFWTPGGALVDLSAETFGEFQQPGYAKAAWNFSLEPAGDHRTRLATETRILCTDNRARRRFSLYWALIGPFSGWIRREALRTLRQQAEADFTSARAG